jgi:hypothetical protein
VKALYPPDHYLQTFAVEALAKNRSCVLHRLLIQWVDLERGILYRQRKNEHSEGGLIISTVVSLTLGSVEKALISSGGLSKEEGNVYQESGRSGPGKRTTGQGKGGRVRNVEAKVCRYGEAVSVLAD